MLAYKLAYTKEGRGIMKLLMTCWLDESGSAAIEYALLGSLIAVAVISAVSLIGQNLKSFFFGPVAGNLS